MSMISNKTSRETLNSMVTGNCYTSNKGQLFFILTSTSSFNLNDQLGYLLFIQPKGLPKMEILVLLLFAMRTHVTTKCLRRAEHGIIEPVCELRMAKQFTISCKIHSKLGKIIRCPSWNTNRGH
jgi:hypothetical protein